MSGIPIPSLVPGSPEWTRHITASKVPAILGLSPFDSPFSMWHKMKGSVPPEGDSDVKRRGVYLEPAIVAWIHDQHPDFQIEHGGCFRHRDLDWLTASPDRLLYRAGVQVGILECKSTTQDEEWGQPGTDEVPPGVKAQCLTQLAVIGAQRCVVGYLGSFLTFAEYVVEFDEAEWAYILGRLVVFKDSLDRDERPSIDGHSATYQAVRQLHPDIEDVPVEIPADLAIEYKGALRYFKAAESLKNRACSDLLDAMGSAKKATYLGDVIATRQSRGAGAPFLKAARGLLKETA